MLYLAICTEGENSEPAFIKELDRVFSGQSIKAAPAWPSFRCRSMESMATIG